MNPLKIVNEPQFFPPWFQNETSSSNCQIGGSRMEPINTNLLDWSKSSDEDPDHFGPLPSNWQIPRSLRTKIEQCKQDLLCSPNDKVALNAVIVELEEVNTAETTLDNNVQTSTSKGKAPMKPEPVISPIEEMEAHKPPREKIHKQRVKASSRHWSRFTHTKFQVPEGGYFTLEGG